MSRMSICEWAMEVAELTAKRSTCLSRQVGAVIVKGNQLIATGYNGAPCGAAHCSDRSYCSRKALGYKSGEGLEHCRAAHAESNAIDQCAKLGVSCEGATLYVTTQPCVFCAIRIIQSGIKKVVFKGEYPTQLASELANETNLVFIRYEGEIKNILKP